MNHPAGRIGKRLVLKAGHATPCGAVRSRLKAVGFMI
jgi:hypothetical protein